MGRLWKDNKGEIDKVRHAEDCMTKYIDNMFDNVKSEILKFKSKDSGSKQDIRVLLQTIYKNMLDVDEDIGGHLEDFEYENEIDTVTNKFRNDISQSYWSFTSLLLEG